MAQYVEGGDGMRLVIKCSDERSEPFTASRALTISVPGGVLDPLCSCTSGASVVMKEVIFIDRIKLLIAAKRPVAIEIVTHAHCAAQALIGFSDADVQQYVETFVAKLRCARVLLPVVVMHDDHCVEGRTRRHRLRLRCDPAIAA
jgi:hypothetical protein